MKARRKLTAVVTAGLLATGAFAIPALGGDSPPQPLPPPKAQGAEADTGFKALGPVEPFTVNKVCGSSVVVTDIVNTIEVRFQTDEFGSFWVHLRGKDVVQIEDAKSQKSLILDNSGSYAEFDPSPTGPNADSYYGTIGPKNLVYPYSDAERKAFRAAKLPDIFYLTKGEVDVLVVDGMESLTVHAGSKVYDVCTLLSKYGWQNNKIAAAAKGASPVFGKAAGNKPLMARLAKQPK